MSEYYSAALDVSEDGVQKDLCCLIPSYIFLHRPKNISQNSSESQSEEYTASVLSDYYTAVWGVSKDRVQRGAK